MQKIPAAGWFGREVRSDVNVSKGGLVRPAWQVKIWPYFWP